MHEHVDRVITKAAYILFFRRVQNCPRTLENLRAADDRCREDGEWMKEALSASVESRGAMAFEPDAANLHALEACGVRISRRSSANDGGQDHDGKKGSYDFYHL